MLLKKFYNHHYNRVRSVTNLRDNVDTRFFLTFLHLLSIQHQAFELSKLYLDKVLIKVEAFAIDNFLAFF